MANDHYGICRDTKEFIYLGEFYEYDGDFDSFVKRFDDPNSGFWDYRMEKRGYGIYCLFKLLHFMKRNQGKLVEVIHENDFYDIVWSDWNEVYKKQ